MKSAPLKIAVIQLTRTGDLIQTAQAVRQFRAENPDTKISLIARRKFAEGLTFLLETVFDDIYLFDTKDFFTKKTLKDARTNIHNFIFELNQNKYDVCVNLSFNKSSSFLSSLINCKLRLGLHRNKNTQVAINDNWSKYVYSNVMNSENNPFSLVDIYRYIMGGQEVLTLDDDNTEERKKQIVIHPFASDRKKRWGVNKWNELLFKLAKENENHTIHIVGGPEDAPEAQRIINSPALKSFESRLFIHAGQYNIAHTYQLLMQSELFVGHDSLVSHIASETLTPSIVISLGMVRPHETTAYQANVINIAPRNQCYPCKVETRCDLLPCHNSINHQTVAQIAKGLINKEEINTNYLKDNLNPFQLDMVRIFKSEYDLTGLRLKELSSNYMNLDDVFKAYYSIIWQCYLRDTDLDVSLPDISEETAKQLYRYKDGISYLYDIYNFGVNFSNKIIKEAEKKDPDYGVIQEQINKMSELDQMCSITKKSYPHLRGLVDYFYVHKANTPGNNILEISKNNLLAYYDASNLTAVLYEFVEKSIAPHIKDSSKTMEV